MKCLALLIIICICTGCPEDWGIIMNTKVRCVNCEPICQALEQCEVRCED